MSEYERMKLLEDVFRLLATACILIVGIWYYFNMGKVI